MIPDLRRHRLSLALAALSATLLLAQCTDQGARAATRPPSSPAAETAPSDVAFDGVRLLVSGSLQGRLEPCGCSSGQLGGLPRRMQHIAERPVYDLMLEGGDLVAGTSELDVLKASTAMMVLFQMQHPYDALGIGRADLLLPLDEWVPLLAMVPGVLASDLECARRDWPGLPFVEKTVRGHTVRVASFTSRLPDELPKGEDAPFRILPPADAWRRALDGCAAETLRILMLHDTDQVARKLIPTLTPRPDLVICMDTGYSEPGATPELVDGIPVVYPGIRGRVLLDLTLTRNGDGPRLGYTAVPLRGSKTVPGGGDPDVRQMLLDHREYVAETRVLQQMANREPTPTGARYVGTATCSACHQTAMATWQRSPHAKAWHTLVEAEKDPKRYGWPVTRYPDCVKCHVVGYGQVSGFVDAEVTPNLWDVGCERCHGPGSRHNENPKKFRLGLLGGVEPSELCVQCHDFEQSPDFLYGDKWPLIRHGLEAHMKPGATSTGR